MSIPTNSRRASLSHSLFTSPSSQMIDPSPSTALLPDAAVREMSDVTQLQNLVLALQNDVVQRDKLLKTHHAEYCSSLQNQRHELLSSFESRFASYRLSSETSNTLLSAQLHELASQCTVQEMYLSVVRQMHANNKHTNNNQNTTATDTNSQSSSSSSSTTTVIPSCVSSPPVSSSQPAIVSPSSPSPHGTPSHSQNTSRAGTPTLHSHTHAHAHNHRHIELENELNALRSEQAIWLTERSALQASLSESLQIQQTTQTLLESYYVRVRELESSSEPRSSFDALRDDLERASRRWQDEREQLTNQLQHAQHNYEQCMQEIQRLQFENQQLIKQLQTLGIYTSTTNIDHSFMQLQKRSSTGVGNMTSLSSSPHMSPNASPHLLARPLMIDMGTGSAPHSLAPTPRMQHTTLQHNNNNNNDSSAAATTAAAHIHHDNAADKRAQHNHASIPVQTLSFPTPPTTSSGSGAATERSSSYAPTTSHHAGGAVTARSPSPSSYLSVSHASVSSAPPPAPSSVVSTVLGNDHGWRGYQNYSQNEQEKRGRKLRHAHDRHEHKTSAQSALHNDGAHSHSIHESPPSSSPSSSPVTMPYIVPQPPARRPSPHLAVSTLSFSVPRPTPPPLLLHTNYTPAESPTHKYQFGGSYITLHHGNLAEKLQSQSHADNTFAPTATAYPSAVDDDDRQLSPDAQAILEYALHGSLKQTYNNSTLSSSDKKKQEGSISTGKTRTKDMRGKRLKQPLTARPPSQLAQGWAIDSENNSPTRLRSPPLVNPEEQKEAEI